MQPGDEVAVLTAQNDGHPVESRRPARNLEDIIHLREGTQNVIKAAQMNNLAVAAAPAAVKRFSPRG